LFNLELQKKGPEFSQIDDLRLEYIQKYAGKVPMTEIPVPKDIPGNHQPTQDSSPRSESFLPTADYGVQQLLSRETESLTCILTISIPEQPFPSSFLSCSTGGGDTQLSPGTR